MIPNEDEKSAKLVPNITPVFTKEEAKGYVKGFISAYIVGNVRVRLLTRKEHMVMAKETGTKMTPSEAERLEIDGKSYFDDLVAICSGIQKASDAELENAFTELFKIILAFRNSDRLEGKFNTYDIEDEVRLLKERFERDHFFLIQLIDRHRSELEGDKR